MVTRSKPNTNSVAGQSHPRTFPNLINQLRLAVPENGSKSKARTARLVRAFVLRAPHGYERNSYAQHTL